VLLLATMGEMKHGRQDSPVRAKTRASKQLQKMPVIEGSPIRWITTSREGNSQLRFAELKSWPLAHASNAISGLVWPPGRYDPFGSIGVNDRATLAHRHSRFAVVDV
jgi:hypothetical protein